eukprot:scaffold706_cov190-Alexandrium_tamarense.AAC.12
MYPVGWIHKVLPLTMRVQCPVETQHTRPAATKALSHPTPSTMTRYSVEPDAAVPHSKSRGSHLRVHYKHCREIAHHIKGMSASKANKFLEDVLARKAVVPFTRHTGGIGRKAMAKQCNSAGDKGRWPVKATAVVKDLLSNAVSNGETKGLDADKLYISHAQVNRAPPGRRRTYRAHGRIGKYASQPAHIELILTEKQDGVEKADDEEGEGARGKRITKKMAAKKRFVQVGGGSA